MEEFLKQLNINDKYNIDDDGSAVIDLDEKQFFRYESLLDKSIFVELDEDSSNISYETITKQYYNEEFILTLIGDLEGDTYRLVVKSI